MKAHTSSFKEQIKLIGKEIDSKITFGDTVLGKNDLNAVTPSYQGAILKSVMKQLDIDSNVAIPIGTILKYEFGLKVNGKYEYINYGNYVVYSIEKQEDTGSYKIVCYDKLLYSMLDYVKLPITYPISIRDYINAISTALGLKFANKSGTFANYNKQIQADLYDGLGYTFRDILDELAQVTASTICLNNNDELEIRYITETNDTIDEEFLKDVNVNFGEKFGAVNTIVLSRSAGSDNIYYPTVLPTNPYEIKISDNQIMNGNDRADFLPDIYNKLNGLEFYTNDFVSTGIVYYDLCDRYSVKVGDTSYSCVMFNDEVLVTQGLEENVYTELPEQTETDYKKADTTDRRINQAYSILDKQNKKFEVLVSEVDSNGEKIGSLEITTSNISTKVSSVEKNLSTTNSNLSNLSGEVDTLSDNINGVSADFEEFKDNEYIQSIDNLQKQIDGAIQFWNGAEIPTINNYPANLWATENDKINHQADIYTVIEDIDGEMKQGKSYRFDKIDGVWQWIELTDNELSAVQAIAQEALNKANSNNEEIGTIKTKVSTLEQSDEQIKASVESIDKQIIPTTNISGSNIYVEDASDNPLTYLEIEGKSTQETRSGKNLLKNTLLSREKNGITVTKNTDGTITLNGTATALTDFYVFGMWNTTNNKIPLKAGTTYTASVGSTISKLKMIMYTFEPSATFITQVSGASSITFKPAEDVNVNAVYLQISNGATFNNVIVKPQLEKGSATEYEQYGTSPSPDYPSEIESVGYENLFNIETIIEGYVISSTGDLNQAGAYCYSDYIKVEPNKDYYLSWVNLSDVEGSEDILRVAYYDSNKTFISRPTTNTHPTKLTIPSDGCYLRISYMLNANTDIMISTNSYSYISYGKYGIEVKTVGKNLFNYIDTFRSPTNGLTNTINEDGSITVSGLVTKNYTLIVPATNITDMLEDGQTYTLSQQIYSNKVYMEIRGKNKLGGSNAYYNASSGNTYRTFRVDKEKYDYEIYITATTMENWGAESLTITNTYQLEKSSVATEFEKYQENAITIAMDEPLRSLPNGVKDIAYIRNNKLYVDRYVGKVVLDGSETWGTHNNQYYTIPKTNFENYNLPSRTTNILCNYFKIVNDLVTTASIGTIYSGTNNLNFNFDDGSGGVANFKTWLSTHNTEVLYELATPVTEELGEIEILKTLKGYNDISTTDQLLPIINLTYVRDTVLANYVENHVAELKITENEIKESVESVSSSVDGLNTTINRVEEITTDNSQVINIISSNIDRTTGEVREVTTTTGFTFNADGMTIDDGSGFKAQHRSDGTYYKDGESIVGQYTKDGSKQKDLELFGIYSYGKENIDDTPMFIGQLYRDENGEECFGHFYNGEGY